MHTPPSLLFAVQSELEDLCFAVLQPVEYRALRRELDELWGVPTIPPQVRRACMRFTLSIARLDLGRGFLLPKPLPPGIALACKASPLAASTPLKALQCCRCAAGCLLG